jgi:hydroxyacylglutathione hydrolase
MALPDNTKVYCGHEYTESNLRFALSVEPNNPKLLARFERVQGQRTRGLATVPSTMEEEKLTNPFLRWDSKEIQASVIFAKPATGRDPVSIFGAVRKMKDAF